MGEKQRVHDADLARRQREHDAEIARLQRENDRLLAGEARQQARKQDAYVAAQRYLGNWLRPVGHKVRRSETNPPAPPPAVDEIGLELEALLGLVASAEVESQLREFNKLGIKWGVTVSHYDLVHGWAEDTSDFSEKVKFIEQAKGIWNEVEGVGQQMRDAAKALNNQMRTELYTLETSETVPVGE